MLGSDYVGQNCAIASALEVVGERWTLLIVRDAFYGVRRFTDLQAHLDIPKAVLSERLGGLVEQGILSRHPDPEHRGRHLYELTEAGRALWPVLYSLLVWGSENRSSNSRRLRHAQCGTELDGSGGCAACGVVPGPQDIVSEPIRRKGPRREDPVAVALRAPRRLLEPLDVG